MLELTVLGFIGAVMLAPFSDEASFDCKQARSFVEKSICADPELSRMDGALAQVYREALGRASDPNGLKYEQRDWLRRKRDLCRDVECIRAAYAERLQQLGGDSGSVPGGWGGEWTRLGSRAMDGASLTVKNVSSRQFDFQLSAFSGSHTGEVEGSAQVTDAVHAEYQDQEGCHLAFLLSGEKIAVSASEGCFYHAGAGVFFDGDYGRGQLAASEPTLQDYGILTAPQEQAFKQLVGKDYPLFAETFQLINEEQDLDGLQARVYSAGVKGMFTLMEAILMVCPDGSLLAAVIDDDKVKYFSSHPQYKTRLPKTIEQWRSRFSDKAVVFGK
jgi:uncharacterized protein